MNYQKRPRYQDQSNGRPQQQQRQQTTINGGSFKGYTVERSPDAFLKCLNFVLEYHNTANKQENCYYQLVVPERPECTLRLYRGAMVRLLEKLPRAFKKAQDIEQQLEDGTYDVNTSGSEFEVATINEAKKSMCVKLYVSVYESSVSIFVRLYVDQATLPPKQYEGEEGMIDIDEGDGPLQPNTIQQQQQQRNVGENVYYGNGDGSSNNNNNNIDGDGESQQMPPPPPITWLPTKRGVRISPQDNMTRLVNFICDFP